MSGRKLRAALFEDADSMTPVAELTINKEYAHRLDIRKQKQDLDRARHLGIPLGYDGSEAGSATTDSSSDDDIVLDPEIDGKIVQTIAAIRRRDPTVYDASRSFFSEGTSANAAAGERHSHTHGESEDALPEKRAKDLLREQVLASAEVDAADAFDEDADDGIISRRRRALSDDEPRKPKVYDDEQAALRSQFLRAALRGDETAQAEAFLSVRHSRDDAKDGQAAVSQLPNRLKEHLSTGSGKLAEHADEIGNPEAFLESYLRTSTWDHEDNTSHNAEEEFADLDQDAEAVDKIDEFEAKYNFRFEDPAGVQVISHSRTIQDSLRRKDSKRKEERERRRARKEQTRQAKEAEVRRLMNLKREELKHRMKKIEEVAGISIARFARVFSEELDKDFDPVEYDTKMAALFDDEYYAHGEPDVVTEVDRERVAESPDEDRLPGWVYGDGERPAWAGPSVENLARGIDGFEGADGGDSPSLGEGVRKRKKHREVGNGAPMDDADDVLALGFEDVIGDGLKTRFHYRQVPAQDFGLTAEDILAAEDRVLNQYVGLRKLAPYREHEWTVPAKKQKYTVKQIRKTLADSAPEVRKRGREESAAAESHAVRSTAAKPQVNESDGGVAPERSQVNTDDSAIRLTEGHNGKTGLAKNLRHRPKHQKRKKAATAEIKLPSGVVVKQSRLASYGL